MKKRFDKWALLVLIGLFLLPLFKLNVTGLHGWGGDFAQYIHQAINIVDNKPIDDIGYIYNKNHPGLAPLAYPVGLPMLLAPVYAMFGNDMVVFMLFMSLLVFLMGMVFFKFLKEQVGVFAALLGVVILIYNPFTINFKSNIVSDFPFTLFLLLSAVSYTFWQNKRLPFVIGLMIGFTVLIRSIGYIILIAVVLDKLIKIGSIFLKKEDRSIIKKELIDGLIVLATAVFVIQLFHKVIFPLPESNNYVDMFTASADMAYLTDHFKHYFVQIKSFFIIDQSSWLSHAGFWMFFVLALVGIITQKKETLFLLLIILGVFFTVVLYPYLQRIRFVFPIFPFLIYYFLKGSQKLLRDNNHRSIFLGAFLLLTLFFYVPQLIKAQQKRNNRPLTSGPQMEVTIEAFDYVKKNIPENAKMVFQKPRVLSLYTDRACMRNSYTNADTVHEEFKTHNIDYVLINNWIGKKNTIIDQYVNKYGENHLDSVWSNSRYRLYKFLPTASPQ